MTAEGGSWSKKKQQQTIKLEFMIINEPNLLALVSSRPLYWLRVNIYKNKQTNKSKQQPQKLTLKGGKTDRLFFFSQVLTYIGPDLL